MSGKRFRSSLWKPRTEILAGSREKHSPIHISCQIFPDHPLYHIIDNIYIPAYCRGGGAFWCSKSGSLGRLDCHRSMLATYSTIKTVRVPTIWDLNNINSQFWYQVPYPIITGIYTFTTKRDRIHFFSRCGSGYSDTNTYQIWDLST